MGGSQTASVIARSMPQFGLLPILVLLPLLWPQFAALVVIGSTLFALSPACFRKALGTMA